MGLRTHQRASDELTYYGTPLYSAIVERTYMYICTRAYMYIYINTCTHTHIYTKNKTELFSFLTFCKASRLKADLKGKSYSLAR